MNLNEIIEEFKKYDESVFVCYHPIGEIEIVDLESKLKKSLPEDFKNFLLISNGASINCHELYGINPLNPSDDLYDNYLFETKEAGNPMPEFYLPIYPDGMGNHNCLDLNNRLINQKGCDVIFWQHDRLYDENEQPDIDAFSFTQFLEELLLESSRIYNYDGTEKEIS